MAALQAVNTSAAPKAGPYSQAMVVNGMVFTAGQIGTDPATDAFVEGGVQEQTHQVFKNLAAVLEAAGTGFDKVVKTTVFLSDMNDFAAMNAIYSTYFPALLPARSTVQVARLPKDALVEIELIAVL
jgi:2-iminobutanoate/2-iminopropanoate deaminase